jgi:hypothetical protein
MEAANTLFTNKTIDFPYIFLSNIRRAFSSEMFNVQVSAA